MNDVITYIIRFLMGEHVPSDILKLVGYTSNPEEYAQFRLVIKPSGFFDENIYGTEKSLPKQPLQQWEEVPILFGEEITENINGTLIIHADIIAGTYFLISRYEEMVRSKTRDAHNRFPGKESLPYKAGFIDRPIIEEWGALLRTKMRETGIEIYEPEQKIKKDAQNENKDQKQEKLQGRKQNPGEG